jgi:hypothetical protein
MKTGQKKISWIKKITAAFCLVIIISSVSMFFMPSSAEAFSLVYTCQGSTLGQSGALPNGERECDFVDLLGQINQLVTDAFILAIPLATIVFTWAGIKLMTSQGNRSSMEAAKKMLWSAAIGFIFICAAWLIVYFIVTSLGCPTCAQFL